MGMFYFRIKYFLSETDDGQLDVHFCYYNNDISLTPLSGFSNMAYIFGRVLAS